MAEDSNNEVDAIKKITLIQATFRGRLARLKIREARQLYRDTVESIEGVTKADELQWVVHGCVPVPVHKLKEPEVAMFMRRLTERNLPDKTRRVVDMAGTSNSDSDTGTYVVSTSEKYSSIASIESSTLSSKTTSSVDGDFKSDEENTDETGSKTSERSQQELDNKNFEKFCDTSDMNMENKMEEGSVGEDRKTVDRRNTKMNVKSQTYNDDEDDTTKNLQTDTETRKIVSQGDDSLQPQDVEIGELRDGQRHRNSEDFQTEAEHGGHSRGSNEESEFNQMEIRQQRSDGKERVQSDLESFEMELVGENVHERCDRNRECGAVDERLQEGMTDEDGENLKKQEQEERLVSGGEENRAGLTQNVDNESKQNETSSKTTTMQVDEKLSTDCGGNEVKISSGEVTSLDRNGESSKEADGKSKVISDGREIEEKRKTETKNGTTSFIPPSPISHQRLPDNEQNLLSSSPILSHDATELSVLSQSNNGLKNGISAVDGDSTMLTRVSSLASSSVWEDTSVWDSEAESAMGTSHYPQDLTELQALRKNVTMELLWVQQAIESRKSYLRLKTNWEDKAKSQNLQT